MSFLLLIEHKRYVAAQSAIRKDVSNMRFLYCQIVKLKAFSKFENTTEALAAACSLVDSKLGKGVLICNGRRRRYCFFDLSKSHT